MCGRFIAGWTDTELQDLIQAAWCADDLPGPSWNICPTQRIRVLNAGATENETGLIAAKWAFVPHWAKTPPPKPMINARAETLVEKPYFKSAALRHRVLVPAGGWYEWVATDGKKQPWLMTPTEPDDVFGFAAVLAQPHQLDQADTLFAEPPLPTVALVTTAAQGRMTEIHHRAPLVLDRADWAAWLDPKVCDPGTVVDLMVSQPPVTPVYQQVSDRVNSGRANDPELTRPVAG